MREKPVAFALAATLSGALAGYLIVATAVAQTPPRTPQCAPRAEVLELVEGQQGQSRRAIGLSSHMTVMELYASEARGTWTLLVTLPSGLSCLVAAGTDFEASLAPAMGAPA